MGAGERPPPRRRQQNRGSGPITASCGPRSIALSLAGRERGPERLLLLLLLLLSTLDPGASTTAGNLGQARRATGVLVHRHCSIAMLSPDYGARAALAAPVRLDLE